MDDKFFDTLLLDKKILKNLYDRTTNVLSITYENETFDLSLQGFLSIYPQRKEYTLQTAGLYYIACSRNGIYPSFIRDDVLSNYNVFKVINQQSQTEFISLLLISIPAYLIPVVTDVSSTSAQEVLKAGKRLPKLGRDNIFSKENGDGWIYTFLIATGMFIVFTMLIIIFMLVRMNGLKYQFIPMIKNESSGLVQNPV
jgi:hypothetical protein